MTVVLCMLCWAWIKVDMYVPGEGVWLRLCYYIHVVGVAVFVHACAWQVESDALSLHGPFAYMATMSRVQTCMLASKST